MAKIVLQLLLALSLFGADVFVQKCVRCHTRRHLPLKPIFFDYLLYYSSERGVKKAMLRNLTQPDPKRMLVKNRKPYKHPFSQKTLRKALDIYWEKYKVIGKIR